MATEHSAPEGAKADLATDTRVCTCHPNDSPPMPCPRKFALWECKLADLREELREFT